MVDYERSVDIVALLIQVNSDELKVSSADENTSRHTIQLYLAL
jgi:hypothetical protein